MIPPVIPVQLYVSLAAATQLTNRRAKDVDGEPSSDNLAQTFNAVLPSSSSQAENGARQVGARFKPFETPKSPEEIEDEEEKLLHVLAGKFGIKEQKGVPLKEAAAFLREILYSSQNSYDLGEVEKELGLDLIGITLKEFLDAMIDSQSAAAEKTSAALKNFLDHHERLLHKNASAKVASREDKSDHDNHFDNDLGLYSPFSK